MNTATQTIIRDGLIAALTLAKSQVAYVKDELTDIVVGRIWIDVGGVLWLVTGGEVRVPADTVEDALAALQIAAKAEIAREGSYLGWRLEQYREQQAVAAMPEPQRSLTQRLHSAEGNLVCAEHRNIRNSAEIAGLRAEISRLETELAALAVAEAA